MFLSSYYNEIDGFAAAWLRDLIGARLIPHGYVEERSIVELDPAELRSFRQCHFFAGIGGWPYALALAGWPADRGVWTGSCPCQPFSSAGQRKGYADERHLWPAFYRFIAECRPSTIFGEQVASKDGREWLAGVRADLEGLGYAFGAADLCAAGIGAPHIRQRLFWVADAGHAGDEPKRYDGGNPSWLGDTSAPGRRALLWSERANGRQKVEPDRSSNPWPSAEWLPCLDGKARRIEPGAFPLADGVPARVGRLRGYGNAIVPQVAAEFVRAFMECEP